MTAFPIKQTDRKEVETLLNQLYFIDKPLSRGLFPKISFYESPTDFKIRYRKNSFDVLKHRYLFYLISDTTPKTSVRAICNKVCSYIGVRSLPNSNKCDSLINDYLKSLFDKTSWISMWRDNVYVIDNPVSIEIDNDGLLHCEDGPSVVFKNDEKFAHWHGTEIPIAWVTGNLPSPKSVLTLPNMDMRAAACQMIGWSNILAELKAKVIDDSEDPLWGVLLEVKMPVSRTTSSLERFLRVTCGTGREFALPVPPETKTVDEAQSVLHGGLPVEILRFSVDRT